MFAVREVPLLGKGSLVGFVINKAVKFADLWCEAVLIVERLGIN